MLEYYDAIQSLADIPELHARHRPGQTALICEGRRLSYESLAEHSNQVARGLIELGLEPQSRVAWIGPDNEKAYEVLFGCAKAGLVMTGINWRLEPNEIQYILQDSEAQVLFLGTELVPTIEPLLSACPRLKAVIVLSSSPGRHSSYIDWRDQKPAREVGRQVDPSQAVVQMYTSGTSGRPKGVVLSHRCFIDLIREQERAGDSIVDWQADDITLLALPTFHIGGIWFGIHGLVNGVQNVMMKAFNAATALELIETHSITKLAFVPAMLRFILSEPASGKANLSSCRRLIYGGSPMPRPVLEKARALFKCPFAQNYGLSETTNMAVFLPPEEHVDLSNPRLKSAGKPLKGVSLRIVDSDGKEVPVGQTGQILFKTPAQMLEYWKLPEDTARCLVGGWVHTGDAGHVDEDGFVYVTDRIKDLIISAGENIYPAEIERVLVQHPEVTDVAVIGVPDDRWGEVPVAFVVKRTGSRMTKSEVLAFVRQRLAAFKILRSVEWIDALPRNASGKILKRVLREPYWAGREKRVN